LYYFAQALVKALGQIQAGANDTGPRLAIELRQKIIRRAATGETPYAIAKALGIDRHTAMKYSGLFG
jgi:hypothetical protein